MILMEEKVVGRQGLEHRTKGMPFEGGLWLKERRVKPFDNPERRDAADEVGGRDGCLAR
jgi:hypothetical protein